MDFLNFPAEVRNMVYNAHVHPLPSPSPTLEWVMDETASGRHGSPLHFPQPHCQQTSCDVMLDEAAFTDAANFLSSCSQIKAEYEPTNEPQINMVARSWRTTQTAIWTPTSTPLRSQISDHLEVNIHISIPRFKTNEPWIMRSTVIGDFLAGSIVDTMTAWIMCRLASQGMNDQHQRLRAKKVTIRVEVKKGQEIFAVELARELDALININKLPAAAGTCPKLWERHIGTGGVVVRARNARGQWIEHVPIPATAGESWWDFGAAEDNSLQLLF
ncbi:hypothetical protein EJ08DRAFT_675987 [Tothia fuscella]|uniref:Uncharacterized protein n=1 Tax=Tothia fuscella TaxID=1048955 RepID=A0A9P4NZH9_9PEZI|nr:hypothetical protein EJ08DRAFT_675987 [Tothia fuscella]